MVTVYGQLNALFWKNSRQRLQCWKFYVFELAFPLSVGIFLVLTRTYIPSRYVIRGKRFKMVDVGDLPIEQINTIIGYYPPSRAAEELMNSTDIASEAFSQLPTSLYKLDRSKHPSVIFDNMNESTVPEQLQFRILSDAPGLVTNKHYGINNIDYISDGLMWIQYQVVRKFISYWSRQKKAQQTQFSNDISLLSMKMPFPDSYVAFGNFFSSFVPIIFVLSFIGSVAQTVFMVVAERERAIKEILRRTGVSTFTYWTSWVVTSLVFMIPIMFFLWLSLIQDTPNGPRVDSRSQWALLLFLSGCIFNLSSFTFLLACLVTRANVSRNITCTLLAISLAVSQLIPRMKSIWSSYLVGSLIFFKAFWIGVDSFNEWRVKGEPSTLSNFHLRYTRKSLSVLDSLCMMFLNTIFHIVLMWYISTVRSLGPGKLNSWYFCVSPSYWCSYHMTTEVIPEPDKEFKRFIEKPPDDDWIPSVEVHNLGKVYDKKIAVAGLNLTCCWNQITVIVGQSGSGKTTTLSMMSGAIPPTEGTVTIGGVDVKNSREINPLIGQCLQEDTSISLFTLQDHLILYSLLRGVSGQPAEIQQVDLLVNLGLFSARNKKPEKLHRQFKRKLSISCAFLGHSKIIFLDEPCADLDPENVKDVSKFLHKMKQGRTIVVTTKSMEVACMLSKRIAILDNGRLTCCGSPQFLMNVYGVGYQLKLVIKPSCLVHEVTRMIQETVPDAKCLGRNKEEILYSLTEEDRYVFHILLNTLELKLTTLHILSLGLSFTTMEDILLYISAKWEPVESESQSIKLEDQNMNATSQNSETNYCCNAISALSLECTNSSVFVNFLQQSRAIFVKKALICKRTWTLTFTLMILTPLLLTLVAIYGKPDESRNLLQPSKSLFFNLDPFPNTTTYLDVRGNDSRDLETFYRAQFSPPHKVYTYPEESIQPGSFRYYLTEWAADNGLSTYENNMVVAANINPLSFPSVAAYQQSVLHSQAISSQLLLNALVKTIAGANYSVKSGVLPLRPISQDVANIKLIDVALMLVLGLVLFPLPMLQTLIIEKQTGSRHMQMLSGTNPLAYWKGTFLWDWLIYSMVVAWGMAAMCLHSTFLVERSLWPVPFVLLITFGCALLPYVYVMHLVFTDVWSGVVTLLFVNVSLGVGFSVYMILTSSTDQLSQIVASVCLLTTPYYSFSMSVQKFVLIVMRRKNRYYDSIMGHWWGFQYIKADFKESGSFLEYFSFSHGIGWPFLCLVCHIFMWWTVLLLWDFHVLRMMWYRFRPKPAHTPIIKSWSVEADPDDTDVDKERKRIKQSSLEKLLATDPLILKDVYKSLDNKPVVDRIHLAVPEWECLGLVGPPGSGKSTTFKMISREWVLTDGNIYTICQNANNPAIQDVISVMDTLGFCVQSNIGYCPQLGGLPDDLTGRETLFLHGSLRGVATNQLTDLSTYLIKSLQFEDEADKLIKTCSWNTKRKLCIAIALVGDPPLLILDQPTYGMDEIGKLQVLSTLQTVKARGKTMLVALSSMEECEALCDKVAVMVTGKLRALGNFYQLKYKFFSGYTVIIQIPTDSEGHLKSPEDIESFFNKKFPGSFVFARPQGYVYFQLPKTNLSFYHVFETVESGWPVHGYEHYSVQQSSLSHIFPTYSKMEAKLTSI